MHSARLFAQLADSYRKKGDLDRAIEVLRKGLETNPNYLTARIILAACLTDQGDYQHALKEYELVLTLDPFHTTAMKKQSTLLALLGRQEEAKESISRYLEEVPDDDAMRKMLTELENTSARPPEGERGNEPQLEVIQETPDEESESGVESGNITENEEIGAVDMPGDDEELISTMTLAEIYASQGFYDKAIEIYQKVLSKEPSNEIAKERIKAIQKGEFERGDQESEKDVSDSQKGCTEKVDWAGGGVPGEVVVDEEYEKFKKWLAGLTRKKGTESTRQDTKE